MDIDLEKFDAAYRERFTPLPLPRLQAQHQLLNFMSGDDRITDLRYATYMLATVKHECADLWAPVEENGRGAGHDYGRPDPITGQTYFGRGYVQITLKDNYRRIGEVIGVDLVSLPSRALEPYTAYQILVEGMTRGLFTGRKLSQYIDSAHTDYIGARAIVNSRADRASEIAAYSITFQEVLNGSVT